MSNAFKAFREARSRRYAAELFEVPHLHPQRLLRTAQDELLKNKDRRTMFTPEQD